MTSATHVRRSVSEYSIAIHELGFVANHDGNVSHRSSESGRFFITPTAVSKRLCAPDTIVECNDAGRPVGRGKPPSEVALHVGAYAARPDINAVIHAHPPHATAFALAQRSLGPITMPEIVVSLGPDIPLVPLFLPKDPAAKNAVGAALYSADVALLAGNGVITVGGDMETAFLRLELVEHLAKILAIAQGSVGPPAPLEPAQLEGLMELRRKAGLLREAPKPASPRPSAVQATVRSLVAEEVRRALGGGKQ